MLGLKLVSGVRLNFEAKTFEKKSRRKWNFTHIAINKMHINGNDLKCKDSRGV